jgi:hypothetical protein
MDPAGDQIAGDREMLRCRHDDARGSHASPEPVKVASGFGAELIRHRPGLRSVDIDDGAEETIAKQRESDNSPAKLAALPKIEKPPVLSALDGTWISSTTSSFGCKGASSSYAVTIAGGTATLSSGRGLGKVSTAGTLKFTMPSNVDGAPMDCYSAWPQWLA